MSRFTKDLFVTWSAQTKTTERAAQRRGVRYFLPELFVDRFANLGGIDRSVFVDQLDGCRTFEDEGWATYWRKIAEAHLATADTELACLGAPSVERILGPGGDDDADALGSLLAPAVEVFSERTPENGPTLLSDFIGRHPERRSAATAIDHLVKAITYLFAASWPGWTAGRLAAYRDSQRLMHVLILGLAPAMDVHVERIELSIDGEDAVAYGVFPSGTDQVATVLITNGLEGTIQEVLLPILRLRDRGIAMIAMEMPGTFQYNKPLSAASEAMYLTTLDQIAQHHRVDANRIGMMGFSFGAHWSTRMAARSPHLKAVVSNGGPYHRSFSPTASFGMPEIMLSTLQHTTGAKNPLDLGQRLHHLSIKNLIPTINVPILAINGDTDTLISTQDSIDLANRAPLGELRLYPNDDHCAMGHYTEWFNHAFDWLETQLS